MAVKKLIPYMGSKESLAKDILRRIPNHVCYVELFCGSAAIYFKKDPSKAEVLNDFNEDLTLLYKVVSDHLPEFMRQLRFLSTNRVLFNQKKLQRFEHLTDVQRAARFYYLQKLSFGGKTTGQSFGTSATTSTKFNAFSVKKTLISASKRMAGTVIENLDWVNCLDRYDRENTFFYADPPYWTTAGYGFDFDFSNYEIMADKMASMQGKMMVSINDHQDIRKVFSNHNIDEVITQYTVRGQGKRTERKELIITNF